MRSFTSLLLGLILLLNTEGISAFQKKSKFDQLVTISTTFGEMKVVLFDDTPLHKDNFITLAKQGYYDSLLFHRVINSFMIQTGDPNSRNAKPRQRLGNGGPSERIPAEILPNHFHKKGALAAARKGDQTNPERTSSGSQFYIVQGKVMDEMELKRLTRSNFNKAMERLQGISPDHELLTTFRKLYGAQEEGALNAAIADKADEVFALTGIPVIITQDKKQVYATTGGAPHLDGQYTVFGEVITGLEIIDELAKVSVDARNRPIEDLRIMISVKRMKRKKITKLYGYVYN
ncbi:peptidylprolyl isomerase [Roseivirga sp.]|uniref:peptidylprolyl isomerase n=1 Tax=Roseivirga sp. TaxID=1964215 RepID=UPI003B8C42FD